MSTSEYPAYGASEIAHYLNTPVSTVRYWATGGNRYVPLIDAAQTSPLLFSFTNLVELHVLSAMRRKHLIAMPNVRNAIDYVRDELGVDRPLANRRFSTDGVSLFVNHYGQLINASRKGQVEIEELITDALVRVEWDSADNPVRLFPYTRSAQLASPQVVVIDPSISGGRAVIDGTRIAIEVIAERYKAGESIRDLAEDYDRTSEEIEEAIRCELPMAA